MAGNVFTGDSSGKHIRAKPRRVKQRTPAQDLQRKAFSIARRFATDNRTLSYYIYCVLNGIDITPTLAKAAHWQLTGDGNPNYNGEYNEDGTWHSKICLKWADGNAYVWFGTVLSGWHLTPVKGKAFLNYFRNASSMTGIYNPYGTYTGNPILTWIPASYNYLAVPVDYLPPHLNPPKNEL